MSVILRNRDALMTDADALVLAIDGAGPGMQGRIARQLELEYPAIWQQAAEEISYPIPPGGADLIRIDSSDTLSPQWLIMVATLSHLRSRSSAEQRDVVNCATRNALELARANHITKVGSGVLAGGWRMSPMTALTEMVNSYFQTRLRTAVPELMIDVLDPVEFAQLRDGIASRHYLTVSCREFGCVIDRRD